MAQKQIESDDCIIAVTIEMGHHANFRKEVSPEGFSHDWSVFVRGYEGSRLDYFVEKVVFKLHKTFKSPVRVIAEPPFRVTESGYAGFTLPIEIHFKNRQTPKKIVFSYDLFLNVANSPPINNVRYEKLKFKNPTPEFKAMLIKAGGIRLGAEHLSNDLLSSARPQNRELADKAKAPDMEKVKKKRKKKKKSSPQFRSASPAPSLSSLSPMSSDNEDSHAAPRPPSPVKKDKESSGKKESSSSSQSKQDSSSSHKDKSKHRGSSSYRERPEKDASHKSHKHKDKTAERDRSSSHKDRDVGKKENSQKVVKEKSESRKDREGSHSSGKSSASSSQPDNKVAVQGSHKEREKSLPSKDKDTLESSKEKLHSSGKDKEKLPKERHSSHKDVSHTSHSEPKKVKEDTSKENDRHYKSSKRHVEPADNVEKEKLKRSSSVGSRDGKSLKAKSTSGKENHASKDSKEKESSKEAEESKSETSHESKHKKNPDSKQHRQKHSSDVPQVKSSEKLSEIARKHENLTHSESLIMAASSQPQLSSPHKTELDEEETTKQKDLKSALHKQSQQTTQAQDATTQKIDRDISAVEKEHNKVEPEPAKCDAKKHRKSRKAKSESVEQKTEHSDETSMDTNHNCYGLDTLAPNGVSIGELIAVTEQIAKAHTDSNRKLLERVTRIIGETDDFDITDESVSFDICSVDKAVVLQIQALFRES